MTGTFTSDGEARPNGVTVNQWLDCVIDSGVVTRVTQHLALLIFALAVRQQQNGVSASVRDLERMTGWSKSMIADHLEELKDVIHMAPGVGRRKSIFELQSLITDAVKNIVAPVVSANARTLKKDSVRECADANPDATVASASTDAIPDAKPSVPQCADAIPDTTAGREPPPPLKERSPPAPPLKKITPPSPTHTLARAREPHMNGVGFVIDERRGAIISVEVVDGWRTRFPDIPDLEAAMERLSCNMLSSAAHPGWSSPQGWMAGILADMNEQAKDRKRVTAARVDAAKPKTKPFKPSRW